MSCSECKPAGATVFAVGWASESGVYFDVLLRRSCAKTEFKEAAASMKPPVMSSVLGEERTGSGVASQLRFSPIATAAQYLFGGFEMSVPKLAKMFAVIPHLAERVQNEAVNAEAGAIFLEGIR
jgi:hypothetical protein